MITHRLFAFGNADETIVLSDGGIVESGTHRQLLRESEIMRRCGSVNHLALMAIWIMIINER